MKIIGIHQKARDITVPENHGRSVTVAIEDLRHFVELSILVAESVDFMYQKFEGMIKKDSNIQNNGLHWLITKTSKIPFFDNMVVKMLTSQLKKKYSCLSLEIGFQYIGVWTIHIILELCTKLYIINTLFITTMAMFKLWI